VIAADQTVRKSKVKTLGNCMFKETGSLEKIKCLKINLPFLTAVHA
jgi:hypothetical protein